MCRNCSRSSISATEADAAVLAQLRELILPPATVKTAREELRRRLALPSSGSSDETRIRLERRIQRLMSQHEWGDIDDAEYRTKRQGAQAELALLPEPEKVTTFEAVAEFVSSLRAAMNAATPDKLKELISIVVERVKVTEAGGYEISLVPAARPFFGTHETLLLAPPDGFEPPTPALGRLRSIH